MLEFFVGLGAAFTSLFGFDTTTPAPLSMPPASPPAIVEDFNPQVLAQLPVFSCADASVVNCLADQGLPFDVDYRATLMRELGLTQEPGSIEGNAALRDALNARASVAGTAPPPGAPPPTSQSVTQPVIVREVLPSNVVTRAEFDAAISSLRADLLAAMQRSLPSVYTIATPPPPAPASLAAFAHSQKIDQLGNVTITNATFNGVTGLTDADIPNDITLTNYMPLSGGTFSGALSIPYLTATSSATSTFAGGLAVSGLVDLATTTITGALTVVGNTTITGSGQLTVGDKVIAPGEIGVGTSTPWGKLSVVNTGTIPSFIVGDEDNDASPFIIDATGKVGIGTVSPNTNLHISGSDYPALRVTSSNSSGGMLSLLSNTNEWQMYVQGNDLRFYDGSDRITFQDGGNVGIGNTAPDSKLEVAGKIKAETDFGSGYRMTGAFLNTNTNGNGYLRIGNADTESGTEGIDIGWNNTSDYGFIRPSNNTDTAKFLTLNTSGNIGIGTASPGAKLQIDTPADSSIGLLLDNPTGNGTGRLQEWKYAGTAYSWVSNVGAFTGRDITSRGVLNVSDGTESLSLGAVSQAASVSTGIVGDNGNAYLAFRTQSGNERMRITAAGNVGIGTTNPSQGLQIISSDVDGAFGAFTSSSGRGVTFNPSITAGVVDVYADYLGGSEPKLHLSTFSNKAGAGGITIDTSGNVGIGTTTPGQSLVVVKDDSGISNSSPIFPSYPSGTWAAQIFNVDDATNQNGLLVANRWEVNNATPFLVGGMWDNGNGFDTWFKIDGIGNVGIGTTTPWRTLSVSGTVGVDGLTGSTGAGSLCLSANREVVYNSASDACLPSLRETKHDISSLSLDGLSIIDTLDPVSFVYNEGDGRTRYGFIAEDTAAVDPHLVTYSASGTLSGIDDRSILSIVVKAIQELRAKVDAVVATVAGFADRITTNELCVGSTCINEEQLAALLANTGSAGSGSNSPSPSGEDESTADTEAPVITILGNNPATLQVGDTYNDLGATVTDNVDTNLGIHIVVGSTPVEQATIDTSEPNEWHIHYVATDNAGNTATSTRTVIVEAPSIVPDEPAEPDQQQEEQEQEEEPASQ